METEKKNIWKDLSDWAQISSRRVSRARDVLRRDTVSHRGGEHGGLTKPKWMET